MPTLVLPINKPIDRNCLACAFKQQQLQKSWLIYRSFDQIVKHVIRHHHIVTNSATFHFFSSNFHSIKDTSDGPFTSFSVLATSHCLPNFVRSSWCFSLSVAKFNINIQYAIKLHKSMQCLISLSIYTASHKYRIDIIHLLFQLRIYCFYLS